MLYRLIGDVHGKFDRYKKLIKNSPPSIQVGDMGVGFRKWPHGDETQNPPHYLMKPGNHRFIRGNHDNPGACKTQSQWILDGFIENDVMFIGGAVSVDRKYRIEGFSWWADEELSQNELDKLIEIYSVTKPRVMITHDAPESIAEMILQSLTIPSRSNKVKLSEEHASRSRIAFEKMLHIHRPELWVFGHWHVPRNMLMEGTRFICLAELETLDIEL